MSKTMRILWGEGMFLRPQHFQQQALYGEAQRTHLAHAMRRHCWGVADLALDDIVLKDGQIRFDRLEMRFRDGTSVLAPGIDPLPAPRNLNEIAACGTRTLLYACPAPGRMAATCSGTARRPARPNASSGMRPTSPISTRTRWKPNWAACT